MAKRNRAAFSREDIEDSKRGHPDYVAERGCGERGMEALTVADEQVLGLAAPLRARR